MSLEMQNENELVMESMVPTGNVEPKEKKVSKSLTMNEKRAMYGILSFLVIANRDGILDDAKTQELMEHLPIFGTVVEKKAYLSQEMFDMKMIEKDILKPMVVEHNNKKKQEKKQEKKKGKVSVKSEIDESKEVKEKKKRVNKKKEEVKEEGEEEVKEEVKEKKKRVNKKKEEVKEEVVKEEVKEEVKEKKKRVNKKKEEVKEGEEVKEKKRGRKTKEQIVECKVDVNVNEGNSQEDQLAELVNQLTDPRDIDVDDLETLLSNLEEEGEEKEGEEEKILPETPRLPDPVPVPVPVQVTKEKVQKKKTPKKKE